MDVEKQKRALIKFAYYGVILIVVYLGVQFLLPPLTPFLIGFLVAWLLHRPAVYTAKKLHISQKIPSALLTAVFYILVTIVIIFAGAQIVSALKILVPQLPDLYTNQFLPFVDSCMKNIKEFAYQIDPAVAAELDAWTANVSDSIGQAIASFSSAAVKSVSSIATGMPSAILKIVLTVVSTFFFSMDFDRIIHFIKRLLPQKIGQTVCSIKERTIHSLKIFIRCYCLIFLLTFAELSIGFLIMRIPYAALIGLMISIIDIMPVLGTGLVLLPWAGIAAFMKNYPIAIGMALLYVIITVIRNTVEPKLVGRQIGLHPLATLISMFLGMQLCGIIGLFVFPIAISLLVQFWRDGILTTPSWIEK